MQLKLPHEYRTLYTVPLLSQFSPTRSGVGVLWSKLGVYRFLFILFLPFSWAKCDWPGVGGRV